MPPGRSRRRWRRGDASRRSDWPPTGTAPTDCSAPWTPGGCRDPFRERACLLPDTPPLPRSSRTLVRRRRCVHVKILMVSWEYPPVIIGGLGRHVHHLATELVMAGHEVVV